MSSSSPSPRQGKVFLVGAGPGDPGLLTLRGRELLARADVVLYDYLANPLLLEHAAPAAEQICLGKHGQSRIWPQEEVNRVMVAEARAGRTVVRLKGGDPAVFARGAEELEALVAAGIEYEVVPGITSALAAASYAGIPITHRDISSAVALVTGQEQTGKDETAIDYAALARFPGTLVFYMGVTTVRHWAGELMAAGKPPETPVALVRRCSFPDQSIVHTTLAHAIDELTPASKLRPPVLVVVGEVTQLGPRYEWFSRRPLFGRSILVTRPLEQCGALRSLLAEQGAEVLMQPAIRIEPPDDWAPVDAALARLADFDWLVFSSANGVRRLLDRLNAIGRDARSLGHIALAAMGPGTADALAEYHLRADLVPTAFHAEALAAELAPFAAGKRFLLARASRGREVLAEELTRAGGAVDQVVVYASRDVETPDPEIVSRLESGTLDWITVTSSAIARSLARLFGETLRKTRLASLSPITSATLRELGFEPAVEANESTMPGLVSALVERTLGEPRQGDSNQH